MLIWQNQIISILVHSMGNVYDLLNYILKLLISPKQESLQNFHQSLELILFRTLWKNLISLHTNLKKFSVFYTILLKLQSMSILLRRILMKDYMFQVINFI